jgi:hypothetical protein
MSAKFLSLLAGAALLGGVSAASAAEPLTSAQMDNVSAGANLASAIASALALGPNTYTAAGAWTKVVYRVGSESKAISFAKASR